MAADEAEQAYRDGATVIFTDYNGRKERGRITGVGVIYAFVRYEGESTSRCTLIADLALATE